jgi:hypothetical protein
VPVRNGVFLDILKDGVFVVVADGRAGTDFAVEIADGEAGESRVGEDPPEVFEGLDCYDAVGWVGVVLRERFVRGRNETLAGRRGDLRSG